MTIDGQLGDQAGVIGEHDYAKETESWIRDRGSEGIGNV